MTKLKLKSKVSLGLTFLFLVILLIGGLGAFFIYRIGSESKEILKDNYDSIIFSKSMMEALDEMNAGVKGAFEKFEVNLTKQEKNITEPGEKELTRNIRSASGTLLTKYSPEEASAVRKILYKVIDVNMQAIVRKNNIAQHTINKVLLYMGFLGSICFLLVFTFILNFPGYIANPIRDLTASIQQIANKNYSERLHFESKDEFGELATAFNSMAQRLDDYENSSLAKLMFEKKRIETIINNMKDPIIGLNEKEKILFVNEEAGKILGLDPKSLIGKQGLEVARNNDLMRALLGSDEALKPFKIYADGKESYFNREILFVSGKNEKDGSAVNLGKVILLKNITKFQELDLAKTNFIATISHELKTPIASIKLSTKLLEDVRVGNVNPEQKELITNIKGETERLLKITGELLDLAQVETGKIHLSFLKVNPREVIAYAVDSLRFQAQQKGILLDVSVKDSLPCIQADLEKTAWVMVNLLSNAIRYAPEKSKILIEVTPKNNNLEFSVQDFGKGIDPKYADKIFDKFFRVPGSNTSGTGLGLAIAKEFIAAQKGEIGLESEAGKGARFWFRLPVAI
jgi:signal transduction histidine kinase